MEVLGGARELAASVTFYALCRSVGQVHVASCNICTVFLMVG